MKHSKFPTEILSFKEFNSFGLQLMDETRLVYCQTEVLNNEVALMSYVILSQRYREY